MIEGCFQLAELYYYSVLTTAFAKPYYLQT
jgi:hypothetical protein